VRPRPHATAKIRLLGAATAVLFMAGCGGSTTAAKPATSPGGTGSTANSRAAYNDCLKKNGVTPPSGRPTGGPGGGGQGGGGFQRSMSPEMQKASQACRSLMPSGGFGGGGFGGQDSSALQAFQACLKTHGVTLPTARPSGPPPSGATRPPGGGQGAGPGLRGLNTSDPKVAAAVKTCRPLLPTGAPTPRPS
jgi:hypothetical protein